MWSREGGNGEGQERRSEVMGQEGQTKWGLVWGHRGFSCHSLGCWGPVQGTEQRG